MKPSIGKRLAVPSLIQIKKSALKELEKIPKQQRTRIITAIDQLAEQPYMGKLLKGDLSALRRLRIGSYRVIYEVNEEDILILALRTARRKDIYR